jgi:hypothetical protein
VLAEPVDALAKMDWRQRWARGLTEVLDQVEKQWTRPTGVRRVVQGTVIFLANWLPPVVLIAALVNLLARFFELWGRWEGKWLDVFMPFIVVLVVLLILQILINIFLPLRWEQIRDEFHRQLEAYVRQELESVYLEVPGDVAETLAAERQRIEKLIAEVHEVASWLEKREQHASIAGLYGQ